MAEKGQLNKLKIEAYTKLDYSAKAECGDFVAINDVLSCFSVLLYPNPYARLKVAYNRFIGFTFGLLYI